MNSRVIYILKKILLAQGKEYVSLQDLSEELRVSLRTIQKDIKVVKNVAVKYNLIVHSFRGKGVQLQAEKEHQQQLGSVLQEISSGILNITETEIRRKNILLRLLTTSDYTSINKLSEEHYVSKTSIVKSLDFIQDWLLEYRIKLIRSHKGTVIQGKEPMIRKAISVVVKNLIEIEEAESWFEDEEIKYLSSYSVCKLKLLFPDVNIEKLRIILQNVEKEKGYQFTDVSYSGLMIHLLILIKRNKLGKVKQLNEEVDISSTYYYDITQSITNKVAAEFNIEISTGDEKYIYQYLMCSGIQLGMDQWQVEKYMENSSKKASLFALDLIKNISNHLHVPLYQDKELMFNLRIHCVAMFERIYYGKENKNPLLGDIKENYSGLFGVILLIIQDIDERIYKKITSDEVGYLTIHLQAALERVGTPKKAIIVCPEGIGFSRLIYSRVTKYIPLLKIIDIVPMNGIKDVDLTEIDLVLSTKFLNIDKPVIVVSSFADLPDIKKINNHLLGIDLFVKGNGLLRLIDKKMFFFNQEFQNKEDIFVFLCKKMSSFGYVNNKFLESIVEREKTMSTEIGRGVAIPHGSKNHVKHSIVGVLTLKKPIKWDKTNVDCVFLLAINLDDIQLNKTMLNDLYNVIDSEEKMSQVRKSSRFEEVKNIILG